MSPAVRGTRLEVAKLRSETIMKPQAIAFHIEPEQIEEVARPVFREMWPASSSLAHEDAELTATKSRLARIMAKEFITIAETAFLLTCSEGHIRNLLKKATNGQPSMQYQHVASTGCPSFVARKARGEHAPGRQQKWRVQPRNWGLLVSTQAGGGNESKNH